MEFAKLELIFELPCLRELAEAEICKNLWAKTDVKEIIKKKVEEYSDCLPRFWHVQEDLLKQVYSDIDKLFPSRVVKESLKVRAECLGNKIWDWLEMMNSKKEYSVDLCCYVDHIKWTNHWTIDSAEVMRSMYYAGVFQDSTETWIILSHYCLEDCLRHFFARDQTVDHEYFQKQLTSNSKYQEVLPFYWSAYMRNCLHQCRESLNIFSFHRDDNWNYIMSNIAMNALNFPTMKYFWKFLSHDEAIKVIDKVWFHPQRYLWKVFESFDTDFLLHIITQPSICQRSYDLLCTIFRHPFALRKLCSWPFENIFIQTLEKVLPTYSINDRARLMNYGHRILLFVQDRERHQYFNSDLCTLNGIQQKEQEKPEQTQQTNQQMTKKENEHQHQCTQNSELSPEQRKELYHKKWKKEEKPLLIRYMCYFNYDKVLPLILRDRNYNTKPWLWERDRVQIMVEYFYECGLLSESS